MRLSETFDDGQALLEAAKQQRLEGIMAERLDSKYLPGRRTHDWLKIKTHSEQEFVVAGYTKGTGRRASSFGALVLGYYVSNELVYAGTSAPASTATRSRSCSTSSDHSGATLRPFREVPKMPKVRKNDVIWVEPSSSPRSSSRSGRTTAAFVRRPTRACARTSPRTRCDARSRSQTSSGKAHAS